MSPTRIPGQPASLCTLADSRSSSATMSGCAQLRLRDSRITCQVVAVDRQCFGARDAALGVEADHARRHRGRQHLAAEQFLCASLGSLGLASGGSGFGSTLPLSCASAAEAPTTAADSSRKSENQARGHRVTLRRTACHRTQRLRTRRASRNWLHGGKGLTAAQISFAATPGLAASIALPTSSYWVSRAWICWAMACMSRKRRSNGLALNTAVAPAM